MAYQRAGVEAGSPRKGCPPRGESRRNGSGCEDVAYLQASPEKHPRAPLTCSARQIGHTGQLRSRMKVSYMTTSTSCKPASSIGEDVCCSALVENRCVASSPLSGSPSRLNFSTITMGDGLVFDDTGGVCADTLSPWGWARARRSRQKRNCCGARYGTP